MNARNRPRKSNAHASGGDGLNVFEWTENGRTDTQTNLFTVMSCHITANIGGGVYNSSNNVVRSLFPQPWDWLLPVMPPPNSVFGCAMLFNYANLPGYHTLTLDGMTNAVQVWLDYYDVGEPALYSGDSMANPPLWSYLWVEAISNGTAALTYTFTGTGAAANFNYSHTLPIRVYEVKTVIADYDSAQWDELPEGKVILSDKETRIKITISPVPALTPQEYFAILGGSLTIKTSGTAPSGVSVPISMQNTTYSFNGNTFEIRKTLSRTELKSLGLLPTEDNDGIFEKAWMDTGSDNPSESSNLSDGLAFETLNAVSRGRSTNYGDLESIPTNSPLHISFFQAAGVEIVTVECAGSKSKPRQLMNQADVFYYSGHGSHASGALTYGNPTLAQPYWSQDLKCVIIAGCSVLDINDYNNNYSGADHLTSPGKLWEPVGPSVLLGYNFKAPLDNQGSANIVTSWIANRGSMGDGNAWMNANDNPSGRNACVIEKNLQYSYFHKYMPRFYRKKTVQKENW